MRRRSRRAVGPLALALLALGSLGAAPAAAYEWDHYVWTYYLALQVGYTPRQAFQVASGAFAIDWDPDTSPMPCGNIDELRTGFDWGREDLRQTWRRYHAFVEQSVRAGGFELEEAMKRTRKDYLWLNALEDGNPGPLLHYTQDYHAHFGWEDKVGHLPWGHHPDFLGFKPDAARRMTEDTLVVLARFMTESLGQTPRVPDRARIGEVLEQLIEAHRPPLTEEELAEAFPNWPFSGMSVAVVADAVFVDADLYLTLYSAGPSIDTSLTIVRRAIRQDERAGRLPWHSPGFVEGFVSEEMPRQWYEYGFDPDAHPIAGDRAGFAVEKPRLAIGEPEVKYERADRDRMTVEIKVPYRLEGVVDTPSFMMPYPVLRTETLSGQPPTVKVERIWGSESRIESRFVVPIEWLREESMSWKLSLQPYGHEAQTVDVTLRPIDDVEPDDETAPADWTATDVEGLLDEMRKLAAAATVSGQQAKEACSRALEIAAAGLSARSEIVGRIEALGNAGATSTPREDPAALLDMAREAAARGTAAAQALGPLRGEAGGLRDQACAPTSGASSPAAGRLAAIENEAIARYAEAERALGEVRWIAATLDRLARPQESSGGLREIVASLQALDGRMREGLGLVDRAVGARGELVGLRARFTDLASQARARIDTAGGAASTPSTLRDGGSGIDALAALSREIDQLTGQVDAAADVAESCDPDAARAMLDAELRASESLRARVEAVLDRPATPGSTAAAEAAAIVKGWVADLEASVAAAELFRDSALERAGAARDCAAADSSSPDGSRERTDPTGQPEAPDGDPDLEPPDTSASVRPRGEPSAPPADDSAPGWTIEKGVNTVGQAPQQAPAPARAPSGQPSLLPSDPTAGLIAGAEGAFARCDFVSAQALADRLAAIAPGHPWLAANYATIARLAAQQRGTAAHLQVAQSLLSSGQLKDARAAISAAARDAPGCMSGPIASLVGEVNAVGEQQREANREALSQGLGTLIGAIGQAAVVVAATQAGSGSPGPAVTTGAGGHTHDAQGRDVPTGGGATVGGAGSPSCVLADWSPAFAAQQLEGEGILWYIQAKTIASGQVMYAITAVGSPGISAEERQAILQRMRQQVGAEYYGPYRDANSAWQAAKARCPNVAQAPRQ